jgi:phosphoglycolate phosphatase-like HAD superfamily hydrolase
MEHLVLFDIDCTLIDGHGAGKRAVLRALREVYGAEGDLGDYSFHGRTDPGIVRDLAALWTATEHRDGDGDGNAIEERLEACLARYVELLREELAKESVELLPGVRQLVTALAADRSAVLGLLTGNVEAGARLKMASTGLLPLFRVAAYGSDSGDRPELPAVAVKRAEALTGRRFTGKAIVIIGDTPADVTCGAHLGVRAIAVATGRYSVRELAAYAPDLIYEDLSDWRRVFEAIVA